MTEESVPGDIGHRVHVQSRECVCGFLVERGHPADCLREHGVGHLVGLVGRGDHSGPERLGEDQLLAGACGRVGQYPLGIGAADHGQSELQLVVAHRVPAERRRPGFGDRVAGAEQNVGQHTLGYVSVREATQIEREERGPSHRVDVGDRVGGSDPPIAPGVVAHRGDEIGGRHQRRAVEQEDTGIVAGLGADQDAIVGGGETAQRSHQL